MSVRAATGASARSARALGDADEDERQGQDREVCIARTSSHHAAARERHEREHGNREHRLGPEALPGEPDRAGPEGGREHGHPRDGRRTVHSGNEEPDDQREQAAGEEDQGGDARRDLVRVDVTEALANGTRHAARAAAQLRPDRRQHLAQEIPAPDRRIGTIAARLEENFRNGPTIPPMTGLFDIAGKSALVTGGSRGIGLMIAQGYVEAGARVYISSRKAEVCDEVASELSKLGTCVSIPADLARDGECERLAVEVTRHEPALNILVNNAGATWGAPLADFPADAWDKVMTLNTKVPFLLTRALVPALEAAGTADDPARVINIGSIDGIQVPLLETYAYSTSKAAIHQLTRHLARQLGPRHITVNAVAPGPFESKMMAATLRDFGDSIARSSPLGRIGRPDDMAGVAIYLASRAGAYLTGAIIPVDGGIATTK